MRTFQIFLIILGTYSVAQTNISPGNVSGTWTSASSPYFINGDITIPNGETLSIEPQVKVIFKGHYKFLVQGRLLAVGNIQDSIYFTAEDHQNGWHSIRFYSTPVSNDTSRFAFCSFMFGKATGPYILDKCGGAFCISNADKVIISDCLFDSNLNNGDISSTAGAAIYISNASPIIKNSTFRNNSGTTDCSIGAFSSNVKILNNKFYSNSGPHAPITCQNNSPEISGNFITHNITTRAGGEIFTITTSAEINNNIIAYNQCFGGEGEGGAIKCWINDNPRIINNTIAFNSAFAGGGICCNQNSDPVFINNIIYGNTSGRGSQVNLLEAGSDPSFLYCDIQGGLQAFGGNGSGAAFTGIYDHNIEFLPLFIDTLNDFHISDYSPCIGSGIDSVQVYGIWYNAPLFCIHGTPRPSPAGSVPDMGACENLLPSPVSDLYEPINPKAILLLQNYPNPFNPGTTIKYSVPHISQVQITIFDVLGDEIETLINEEKSAGTYEINWNAADLPGGVYFYQMKTGNFIQTKKMILIK